jgi:coenzyme F420-reducing hydrogenase beta subunit
MVVVMKSLEKLAGKALKKHWSPEVVEKYVGRYRECYFTHAADATIRENAASGGSTTAILSYLLTTGQIDGALVCRTQVEVNKVRGEFFIASTLDEIRSAQGSKYAAVYFATQALPLIRNFEGKLAVTALPCDIGILTRKSLEDQNLQDKVALKISLFCGHNSEPMLVNRVIKRLNREQQDLADYRFREGHWRGQLRANFDNGSSVSKPFSYFSDYQNLYFFCQRKCHHCHDHTGYFGDISAGDIWSLRMKQDPVKNTALITRSETGSRVLREAMEAGYLEGREEPVEEVCEGQARTMPFHYNVTARAKLGWIAGETIRDPLKEKVRWNEYIVAALVLANERISRTKTGQKIIFALPRPAIKLYLIFVKMLESL